MSDHTVKLKKIQKFLKEYNKQHADVVTTYIMLAGNIENTIERIIASFYFFTEKNKNTLIEFLIVDLTLSKKIQVLRNLIRQRPFKHLDTKNLKPLFDDIDRIVRKRNRIVHASLSIQTPLRWDKDKRIALVNRLHSFNQKIYFTQKESYEDFNLFLELIMPKLWELENEVIKVKHKKEATASNLHQTISLPKVFR